MNSSLTVLFFTIIIGVITLPPTCSSLQLLTRSQATKVVLLPGFLALNTASAVFLTGRRELPATTMSAAAAATASSKSGRTIRVLLNGGDNMLGRAVQLSFPVQAPGEQDISDSCPASHYVDMCLHHPSGRSGGGDDPSLDEIREQNRDGTYLWEGYRAITMSPTPDLRILNFESAITKTIDNPDVPTWKGIRYHAHVDNLDAMMRPFAETTHGGSSSKASPAVISLANNHVMDYGRMAFDAETLPALDELTKAVASPSIYTVGSGRDWSRASKPVVVNCKEDDQATAIVEVFAVSTGCSGTPEVWSARKDRSGLVGLPGLYDERAVEEAIALTKRAFSEHPRQPSSSTTASPEKRLRVLSIHMGPNWAMKGETQEQIAARREFAHRIIDEGSVDLIYGHSSHHVRGMEVYNRKLVLYGTGDMINDYEGFENFGEEKYNRLGGIYIADLDAETGHFERLRIVPMFMNRLRLERYSKSSKMWRPNQRRLEVNAAKSVEMCNFINVLSRVDSGGSETALVMEHVDSDPDIPGGPVLVSKVYAAGKAAS